MPIKVFEHGHDGAFAQIVGIFLEGEAEKAQALDGQVENRSDAAGDVLLVGGEDGFEQRQLQIQARRRGTPARGDPWAGRNRRRQSPV